MCILVSWYQKSVDREKKVPGVIGAKAIHLQKPGEREKIIPINMLFIDIGAKSKDELDKVVSIGDYAVFDTAYEGVSWYHKSQSPG